MFLKITLSGHSPEELRFTQGPIYLGRQKDCQVCLACRAVSRHHAVIYFTPKGAALLKDLDSANGTLLNGKPILETPLRTGDRIQIGDALLDVVLDTEVQADGEGILDDTSFDKTRSLQRIVREIRMRQGPDLIMPIERSRDYCQLCQALSAANDPGQVLDALMIMSVQQFRPTRLWFSLRAGIAGPRPHETGITDRGRPVRISDIELRQELDRVLRTGQFLLIPSTTPDQRVTLPGSVMIAPIPMARKAAGVLYLERSAEWKPFALQDLDYLLFVAIGAGTLIDRLCPKKTPRTGVSKSAPRNRPRT